LTLQSHTFAELKHVKQWKQEHSTTTKTGRRQVFISASNQVQQLAGVIG
jgi:hypothetical protein